MEVGDLFSGVAVIIDDHIHDEDDGDGIKAILDQIKAKHIPCVEYNELPSLSTIDHLNGVQFLLLDWDLMRKAKAELEKGIILPTAIEELNEKNNIEFLSAISKKRFLPVFIFTKNEPTDIINILVEHDLYQADGPNYIFVRRKDGLQEGVFDAIEEWLKSTPPVYVLKEWEREYENAKSSLFLDFYSLEPNWAKILWNSYQEGKANPSHELGEVITRNLYSRMNPFDFDDDFFKHGNSDDSSESLRKVLEGERYIKYEGGMVDTIKTRPGDIFAIPWENDGETGVTYLLNIRPRCDTERDSNPELYLIKGKLLNQKKSEEIFDHKFGVFNEKNFEAIVPFICNGKTLLFDFKDFQIKKWNSIKNKRIGQLLPPYITRIQQRYAFYNHREGIASIPSHAMKFKR